jgi:dTDP-4-dehydrorhamnose reductase
LKADICDVAAMRQVVATHRPSRPRTQAIASADYPSKATRPADERLDTTGLRDTFGVALPHLGSRVGARP